MTEDQARRRFMLLNLVRLANLGAVLLGVVMISGKLVDDPLFMRAGYVFVVVGAAMFFVAPVLLKHLWRKPDA